MLNAGDTLSCDWRSAAIGERNRYGQPDSGERPALRTVPVGEHDHRDGRQRRSAEPNFRFSRITGFRDQEKPFVPMNHY